MCAHTCPSFAHAQYLSVRSVSSKRVRQIKNKKKNRVRVGGRGGLGQRYSIRSLSY